MKKINKTYTIAYRRHRDGAEERIYILAPNKEEALVKAYHYEIRRQIGYEPYNVWAIGVTYQNGNYKSFK